MRFSLRQQAHRHKTVFALSDPMKAYLRDELARSNTRVRGRMMIDA